MDPVKTILGKNKIICFKCRKEVDENDSHYWYAFDQDNLVCTKCAKNLKHTETAYRGLSVLR